MREKRKREREEREGEREREEREGERSVQLVKAQLKGIFAGLAFHTNFPNILNDHTIVTKKGIDFVVGIAGKERV